MHRLGGQVTFGCLVLGVHLWAACSLVNPYDDIPEKQGPGGSAEVGGLGGTPAVSGFGGVAGNVGGSAGNSVSGGFGGMIPGGGSGGVGAIGGSGGTTASGGVGGMTTGGGFGGSTTSGGFGGTGGVGGFGGAATTGGSTANGGSGGGVVIVNVPLSADSYICATNWGTKYGGEILLTIRRWGPNSTRRTLIHVDIAGAIPGGATIAHAQLCLTAYHVTESMTINVHRVLASWVESEVTWMHKKTGDYWANMGSDFDGVESAVQVIPKSSTGEICWDVTGDATTFHSTPTGNHGWLLRDAQDSTGTGELVNFRSREYGSDTPRLQVTYLP